MLNKRTPDWVESQVIPGVGVMPKYAFDPKLKSAVEEIDKIMKEYDIGGCFNLCSETHGEWKYYLTPAWSPLRLTDDGQMGTVKIRAKKEDFEGTEDEKIRQRDMSMCVGVHLLSNMKGMSRRSVEMADQVLKFLKTKMEVEEGIEAKRTLHSVEQPESEK